MNGACGVHGTGGKKVIHGFGGETYGHNHFEDLGIGSRVILK
jgi:hypothetical protein